MIIELRRHAHHNDGNLTQAGISLAIKVGETMCDQGYTHFATSRKPRTSQSLFAFAVGAGDFFALAYGHLELDALDSVHMGDWREYFAKHDQILVPEEQLVQDEAARMVEEFRKGTRKIPSDARLLGVGHSPFIECLVYGLTKQIIDPLMECEGVVLNNYNGEQFRLVKQLRLP
ncbi:MAG: hypothetical protein PHS79_05665 [Patescibacteria group bacterium]|nr:hypothetical protein [Patescibacteria group bacterium]